MVSSGSGSGSGAGGSGSGCSGSGAIIGVGIGVKRDLNKSVNAALFGCDTCLKIFVGAG